MSTQTFDRVKQALYRVDRDYTEYIVIIHCVPLYTFCTSIHILYCIPPSSMYLYTHLVLYTLLHYVPLYTYSIVSPPPLCTSLHIQYCIPSSIMYYYRHLVLYTLLHYVPLYTSSTVYLPLICTTIGYQYCIPSSIMYYYRHLVLYTLLHYVLLQASISGKFSAFCLFQLLLQFILSYCKWSSAGFRTCVFYNVSNFNQ